MTIINHIHRFLVGPADGSQRVETVHHVKCAEPESMGWEQAHSDWNRLEIIEKRFWDGQQDGSKPVAALMSQALWNRSGVENDPLIVNAQHIHYESIEEFERAMS